MRTSIVILLALGLVLGTGVATAGGALAHSMDDWEPGEPHHECHEDCHTWDYVCTAITLVPNHPTCGY